MAEVLLFHHAHGQTPGFLEFAQELRRAGHGVHTPDLFEGRVFDDLEDGIHHADAIGEERMFTIARRAADELPHDIVYAGISLGVMPAQALAQQRPGALGLLSYCAAVPPHFFGAWPDHMPSQLHTTADDPWTSREELAETTAAMPNVELFEYPGSGHLFFEPASPDYDGHGAELVLKRTLDFLLRVSAPAGQE